MNIRFKHVHYADINPIDTDQASSDVTTVFLRQVRERCWVVYDKDFSRGGTFRDEKSALRFVRSDIGETAVVIVVRRSEFSSENSQNIMLSNGWGRSKKLRT